MLHSLGRFPVKLFEDMSLCMAVSISVELNLIECSATCSCLTWYSECTYECITSLMEEYNSVYACSTKQMRNTCCMLLQRPLSTNISCTLAIAHKSANRVSVLHCVGMVPVKLLLYNNLHMVVGGNINGTQPHGSYTVLRSCVATVTTSTFSNVASTTPRRLTCYAM